MDITTAPASAQSAATTQSAQPAAEPAISSDFETFLQMLTAQLQNQDPLNPLESQDFAVQLATFSNVEQQTKTNVLLEGMAKSLSATGLGEMSQWIGREAQVAGTLPFTGKPLELTFDLPPGAVKSELVVTDASGEEVSRHLLNPADPGPYVWTGQPPGGAALRPGSYSFEVENTAAEGALPESAVSAYVLVTEARAGPTGQSLLLDGLVETTPDAITALRNPGL